MSGIAGPSSFLGLSATIASVVISRPAMDAASSSAVRTTFAGVDHAELEHVAIFLGLRVEAERVVRALADLAGNDGSVDTCVLCDLTQRSLQRAAHDGDTRVLIGVLAGQALKRLGALDESDTAAHDNAFLNGRAGRVQRVVDAVLALLHLGLGHAADADDRDNRPQAWPHAPCSFSRS